jgi:DNA recombination protein RmuC
MNPLLYLVLGVISGGGVAVMILLLVRRGGLPINDSRLENELRQQLTQRESELQRVRAELTRTNQENGVLGTEAKFLKESLVAERQQIETIQARFQKEFEAVSNKLLVANTSEFSRQSSAGLDALLKPLKDELKDFRAKLDASQTEAAKHSALLKDEISRIGTEAANLSKALKGDVKVLGNWGENMLDQILEKSGLQAGMHYHRQQSARSDVGDQRFLDVIVNLPDKKTLVIDSKVSLKSYEQHFNCSDETLRLKHLQDHIGSVRTHFRSLGAKRYQDILSINTPDFVLMYIPIEAAFFVAIAQDPTLFSEALDKNVVLTTNSTLLATLRTVASVWRLADQQRNAIQIARRGGQLYDKFVGFVTDLQNVGAALTKSQEAWEAATNKLHKGTGNLVRQAEQLRDLGVKASKTIPTEIKAESEGSDIETEIVAITDGHNPAASPIQPTPPLP